KQEAALQAECILCYEDLRRDMKFRELPCRHIFHQPCVDTWLLTRDASCPMCRRTFYHLRRPQKVSDTPLSAIPSATAISSADILTADPSTSPSSREDPEAGTTFCKGPWMWYALWKRRRRQREEECAETAQRAAAAAREYLRGRDMRPGGTITSG
ncbi:hypothetical protein AJ79_08483, partial [Helicocarpus griseus UAMH5409]